MKDEDPMAPVREELENKRREFAAEIDALPVVHEIVAHGYVAGWSDKDVYLSLADERGELRGVQVSFKDPELARKLYCEYVRIELRFVKAEDK